MITHAEEKKLRKAAYTNTESLISFISVVEEKDFSRGGSLNLCDLVILKSLWKDLHPDSPQFPSISAVQRLFRDRHILYMYMLKAEGKAPFSLLGLGFRPETINKYWDNRELAERVAGQKLP